MKTYTITFGQLKYQVSTNETNRVSILNQFRIASIGLNSRKFILSEMHGDENKMGEMIITDENNNVVK